MNTHGIANCYVSYSPFPGELELAQAKKQTPHCIYM